MIIEAVDLTTAPFIFKPEDAFKVAGAVNKQERDKPPIGIEIYPVLPRLVTRLLKPDAVATKERIQTWQGRYETNAIRVHLPWMYNWREIGYEALVGDWYSSYASRAKEVTLMYVVGPATNRYGIHLAQDLGIGVNVHPNVIAGFVKDNELDELKNNVAFVYGENSVEFNALYQKDRKVLGDPRQTVRNDVIGHHLDGFLLAIDHTFGLDRNTDPQFTNERLSEAIEILGDEQIQQHTKAMHLALPGHEFIEVGNPNMEILLKEMASIPFRHPIRVALNVHPQKIIAMTYQGQVNYVRDFRNWVLNTVERYN